MACAVLVRAIKDASRKDPSPLNNSSYIEASDKCTFADKNSAMFFLYNDLDSLRFWVVMSGIRWSVFQKFLLNNKLDTQSVRDSLKLNAWDKGQRVSSYVKEIECWDD
jgi:hypothetical protein